MPNSISLSKKLFFAINKSLLKKVKTSYAKFTNSNLKTIIVTGNVGKTTTTLLVKSLFEENGYTVISGTTLKKNINSFEGLALTLIRFIYQINKAKSFDEVEKNINLEIEGKTWFVKAIFKLKFLITSLYFAYFVTLKRIPKQVVIIYEVGFDYEGEGSLYQNLFSEIDLNIITNLSEEHNLNFTDTFNKAKLSALLGHKIEDRLLSQFLSDSISQRLKNVALEQFVFVNESQNIIYPTVIGTINNQFYFNHGLYEAVPVRGENFELGESSLNLFFHGNYVLPETVAKNILILDKCAQLFDLDSQSVNSTLTKKNLFPYSRFSVFKGQNNCTIIDSTYNNDPASLTAFLNNLADAIGHYKTNDNGLIEPNNILIIGEMRELGEDSTLMHNLALEKIESYLQAFPKNISEVILLGKDWLKCDTSDILKTDNGVTFVQFKYKHFKVFQNLTHIYNFLLQKGIKPENHYWIKGSQNTIFLEILVEKLLLDPNDKQYLCRQSKQWTKAKKPYLIKSEQELTS